MSGVRLRTMLYRKHRLPAIFVARGNIIEVSIIPFCCADKVLHTYDYLLDTFWRYFKDGSLVLGRDTGV